MTLHVDKLVNAIVETVEPENDKPVVFEVIQESDIPIEIRHLFEKAKEIAPLYESYKSSCEGEPVSFDEFVKANKGESNA